MSALAHDRQFLVMLGAAFGTAALLVLVSAWSTAGDGIEHWARARWTLAPLVLCLAAALACGWGAWRRRTVPAAWVPLAGGVATAVAAVVASLTGRF